MRLANRFQLKWFHFSDKVKTSCIISAMVEQCSLQALGRDMSVVVTLLLATGCGLGELRAVAMLGIWWQCPAAAVVLNLW
jgi:hypothetical protein